MPTRPSALTRYLDPQVLSELARYQFQPRDLVVGHLAGGHKSPLAGFAVEFAGHREYVPGDDPKHLDWRVFFNRDKYVTKQYELETNCVAYLLLDDSQSMRYGRRIEQKWEYACRLAMTLGQLIIRRRDQVALGLTSRPASPSAPGNTMVHLTQMARRLEQTELGGPHDLGACLQQLAGVAPRRSVVFVLSDLFGDLGMIEKGVQQLRFDRRQVILLQVLHGDELEFPFTGAVEFAGLEDATRLPTSPADVRQAYLQALSAFQDNLRQLCYRNGCEHVVLRTDRSLAQQLVAYLDGRAAAGRSRGRFPQSRAGV